jgi:hypothetical protein
MAGNDHIQLGQGYDTGFFNLESRVKETIGQDVVQDFDRAQDGLYVQGYDSKNVTVHAFQMFARLDSDKNGTLSGTETSVYARTVDGQASLVLDVGKALGFTAEQHTITLVGITTLTSNNFYG